LAGHWHKHRKRKMVKFKKEDSCPCGSGKKYADCCELYIAGTLTAPDAQVLMRSRYTAYTFEDEAYLQKTWHASSRPETIIRKQEPCKWTGLNVIAHHQEGQTATVEFIAKYKLNGRAEKMHEVSRFVFENGQWFYVEGNFLN